MEVNGLDSKYFVMDYIRCLILILLFASCVGGVKKESSNSNKSIQCTEKEKFNSLIRTVVDEPELQQYIDIESYKKIKNLVILKNSFFVDTLSFDKFGMPVLFYTPEEINSKNIKSYIEFKDISIIADSAKVYLIYDIEGISCEMKYYLDNCKWNIDTLDLWEN